MATAYSSFFASGLLAAPVTIYSSKDYHIGLDDNDMVDTFPKSGGLSPAVPSSPIGVLDDIDIETECDAYSRATTPTLDSRSRSGTLYSYSTSHGTRAMTLSNSDVVFDTFNANGMATINAVVQAQISTVAGVHTGIRDPSQNQAEDRIQSIPRSPSQPANGRRLRKRKSSLAGATSPMSAIKSPSRSAGHALELHRHLLTSPLRSRSGSVSLAAAATDVMAGYDEMSLEHFNFLGRLRSGSTSAFRRRLLRRASTHPPAPPPAVPLPALPPSLADTPTCGFFDPSSSSAQLAFGGRMPLAQNPAPSPNPDDISLGMYRKRRDRSYSINAYDCINEEMKEN